MTLYSAKMLPMHWIVDDGERLWIVPAMADGWRNRTPYRGTLDYCERVEPWYAIGIGIPKD